MKLLSIYLLRSNNQIIDIPGSVQWEKQTVLAQSCIQSLNADFR